MNRYEVEFTVEFNASLVVEAKNRLEAIIIASKKVKDNPLEYCNDVEIDKYTYFVKQIE